MASLPVSRCLRSGEAVQMKKRAWWRAGKPAVSQHRSQDPPRHSSAKGVHLSNVPPPGPAGEYITGWGPRRDRSSDSQTHSLTMPAAQGASDSQQRPAPSLHSSDWLINKTAPAESWGHAPTLWTLLSPANGPAGRGLCLRPTPSHPSTCQARQCEEGWKALTV
ncbi:hypothetical protein CesoFtcFv8_004277 [Champsocephalus esox]|uniref:Uncharacterized protein n=1 Tax=Champsocephalus esox TaxID=159716 RepID=A0AAN8HC02_9TELE|nr:hypothetical protein CesoFtcFv8_004277 [Champsocephalus esox]